MSQQHYKKATYLTSVTQLTQLRSDSGIEVAFAGRSNAGKSSALNALCHQKGLAKTSRTPGRTQMINFFALSEERFLVDLPGYGYAKVPLEMKWRWQKTLGNYLQSRRCLAGIVLLMDARHPLKEVDWVLIDLAAQHGTPLHIVLTKADKLSRQKAQQTLMTTQRTLENEGIECSLQLFSATHKTELDTLCLVLDEWFQW